MTRQIRGREGGLDPIRTPACQRVDPDPAIGRLDRLQSGPGIALIAFASCDPGVEAGQCPFEGQHLAQMTAVIGPVAPEYAEGIQMSGR